LEIVLSEDPAIPLMGIYSKDVLPYHQNTCSTMFTAALFVIARIRKQPRCPSTKEWIQKLLFIYTMGYYLAIKNDDIINLQTNGWK
jgi:glucan phosphoethanolaminetransferase (alkaline phosphatase superfamily)